MKIPMWHKKKPILKLKIYIICVAYHLAKTLMQMMHCNTPGTPAERNASFPCREKTLDFTGKASVKIIRSDTESPKHEETIMGQKSANTIKARFRSPRTSGNRAMP